MKQRLKALREKTGLTQEEFAARLGIKRTAISNYEIGRNKPIDAVISLICREFNVNETWLRTGEGEMFLPKPTAALDALAAEYGLSNGDYVLIEKFLALNPETRQAMLDYMREVVAAVNSIGEIGGLVNNPALLPAMSHPEEVLEPGQDIEAEVEAYRQHLLREKNQASQTSAVKERDAG